jgi:hypothetical protein
MLGILFCQESVCVDADAGRSALWREVGELQCTTRLYLDITVLYKRTVLATKPKIRSSSSARCCAEKEARAG